VVEHNKPQPTNDKLSLKGRGHCHVISLIFGKISDKIWKTVRDILVFLIEFEQKVVCALSNGYVADDLGWPLTTLNHLNFYILHCLMHLCNLWSQRLRFGLSATAELLVLEAVLCWMIN